MVQPNKEHNKEAAVPNAMHMTAWPIVHHLVAAILPLYLEIIYIFGGYGGYGYSRRDLDDLYVLDTIEWTWNKVNAKGSPPENVLDIPLVQLKEKYTCLEVGLHQRNLMIFIF